MTTCSAPAQHTSIFCSAAAGPTLRRGPSSQTIRAAPSDAINIAAARRTFQSLPGGEVPDIRIWGHTRQCRAARAHHKWRCMPTHMDSTLAHRCTSPGGLVPMPAARAGERAQPPIQHHRWAVHNHRTPPGTRPLPPWCTPPARCTPFRAPASSCVGRTCSRRPGPSAPPRCRFLFHTVAAARAK